MSSFRIIALGGVIAFAVAITAFLLGPTKAIDFFGSVPPRSVISPPAPVAPGDPVLPTAPADLPRPDRPLSGALRITSTPAGASFAIHPSVNAEATPPLTPPVRDGVTPAVAEDLPSRRYTIFLRLPGWPEERTEIALGGGETLPVEVVFPHGRAEVTSDPDGAQIFHGDRWLGKAPLTVDLPLGEQELIARATDRPERAQKVVIAAEGSAPVAFDLRNASRPAKTKAKPPSPFKKLGRSLKKFFMPKDSSKRKKS